MKNPADTDRRAFEHFHEQHRMFVWKLCYWHANYNTADAADLFQDVSVALWHRFHTLRPNASRAQQRAWIWFIAHSLFLRLIPAPSPQPLTDDMADQLVDNPDNPGAELLDLLTSSLPPLEQQIVALYRQGYSLKEIAARLDLPVRRVRYLLQKAIDLMKENSKTLRL